MRIITMEQKWIEISSGDKNKRSFQKTFKFSNRVLYLIVSKNSDNSRDKGKWSVLLYDYNRVDGRKKGQGWNAVKNYNLKMTEAKAMKFAKDLMARY